MLSGRRVSWDAQVGGAALVASFNCLDLLAGVYASVAGGLILGIFIYAGALTGVECAALGVIVAFQRPTPRVPRSWRRARS